MTFFLFLSSLLPFFWHGDDFIPHLDKSLFELFKEECKALIFEIFVISIGISLEIKIFSLLLLIFIQINYLVTNGGANKLIQIKLRKVLSLKNDNNFRFLFLWKRLKNFADQFDWTVLPKALRPFPSLVKTYQKYFQYHTF